MIHIKHRSEDGWITLVDDVDRVEFVVRSSDWSTVSMRPPDERRALLEELVLGYRAKENDS